MGGMAFNRPAGGMAFNRPGTTFNRPGTTFTRPGTTFNRQAFNNRGFWDRRHHRFVRRGGAFFAFAAPFWDYGYSDSCWRWEFTRVGWRWVNVCYPYSAYYY
jgi:hypothetical protein